ncbi:MAG: FtsX-like permease family protein, partial [Muribaculaceae bacterium]|nr:FtsX-like permease family protein [Muribaculaceae bacterium]
LSTIISPLLPPDVRALTLLELRQVSFRMIAVEKWVTFSMLVFILLIASFNIISTMSMLIIEKKDNARLLRAMGATSRFVRSVFVTESRLICLAGGIAGMLLGTILVLAQQWGGFIRLTASDPSLLSIDTYPVRFRPLDLLAVTATIVVITLITSAITARLTRSSR